MSYRPVAEALWMVTFLDDPREVCGTCAVTMGAGQNAYAMNEGDSVSWHHTGCLEQQQRCGPCQGTGRVRLSPPRWPGSFARGNVDVGGESESCGVCGGSGWVPRDRSVILPGEPAQAVKH